MLLTYSFHARSQRRQVAMIDCRKEMMLDLIIEPSRRYKTKPTIIAKVLSRHDLVLVEVFRGCVDAWSNHVIDLRVQHEAQAEDCIRYECPNECLPKRKDEEWPCICNADVK